jgi:hypothetical protein
MPQMISGFECSAAALEEFVISMVILNPHRDLFNLSHCFRSCLAKSHNRPDPWVISNPRYKCGEEEMTLDKIMANFDGQTQSLAVVMKIAANGMGFASVADVSDFPKS